MKTITLFSILGLLFWSSSAHGLACLDGSLDTSCTPSTTGTYSVQIAGKELLSNAVLETSSEKARATAYFISNGTSGSLADQINGSIYREDCGFVAKGDDFSCVISNIPKDSEGAVVVVAHTMNNGDFALDGDHISNLYPVNVTTTSVVATLGRILTTTTSYAVSGHVSLTAFNPAGDNIGKPYVVLIDESKVANPMSLTSCDINTGTFYAIGGYIRGSNDVQFVIQGVDAAVQYLVVPLHDFDGDDKASVADGAGPAKFSTIAAGSVNANTYDLSTVFNLSCSYCNDSIPFCVNTLPKFSRLKSQVVSGISSNVMSVTIDSQAANIHISATVKDNTWAFPISLSEGVNDITVSGISTQGTTLPGAKTFYVTTISDGVQEIVAHAGGSLSTPLNTLAAFNLAFQQGADGVELDVWLSEDNRIVVVHDPTTGSISNTNLVVAKTPSSVLRSLDIGSYKGRQFAGERIPFLEDVLAVTPPDKKVMIHIKAGLEILPFLKVVLSKSTKQGQIAVACTDTNLLVQFKKIAPEIPAYAIFSTLPNDLTKSLQFLANNGINGVSVDYNVLNEAYVRSAKLFGLKSYVWALNDVSLATTFFSYGVDGVVTDHPAHMLAGLNSVAGIAARPAATKVSGTTFPVARVQQVGTKISLTAAAQGGSLPYEYEYAVWDGVAWQTMRKFSEAPGYTWDTTGLLPGTYVIYLYAKSAGAAELFQAYQTLTYTLTADAPATGITVTASPAGTTQLVGTTITFSASGQGGGLSYEYQYKVYSGTNAVFLGNYSRDPRFVWSTSGVVPGSYLVHVNVRHEESVATYEAYKDIPYTIIDGSPPIIMDFTLPTTFNSFRVPISTLLATDNVAVGGYCLTEVNDPATCNWSGSKPTSYLFSGPGSHSLYCFAKDTTGNLSNQAIATTSIVLARGDMNGDGAINIIDAVLTLNYTVESILHTPEVDTFFLSNADVAPLNIDSMPEGDGKIDISDALAILRRAVDLLNW